MHTRALTTNFVHFAVETPICNTSTASSSIIIFLPACVCVCVCMCDIYIHIYIFTCVYIYAYVYIHIHTYIYTYVCVCARVFVRVCACKRARVCVYMCLCVCVYTCMCVPIEMSSYIFPNSYPHTIPFCVMWCKKSQIFLTFSVHRVTCVCVRTHPTEMKSYIFGKEHDFIFIFAHPTIVKCEVQNVSTFYYLLYV